MIIEQQTVSRKTPLDGKLEISALAAERLASLGATFPVRAEGAEGIARLYAMSCTCAKAANAESHLHHFVESDILRALEPGTDVSIELDDARPGSLSIR